MLSNHPSIRLVSIIFFIGVIGAGGWGLGYVQGKLFIANDAAATLNNVLANETLFRSGILSHFISTIAFVLIASLLYRMFRDSERFLARIMLIAVTGMITIAVSLELFKIATLLILKGNVPGTMDLTQKQGVVYFLLRMHYYGVIACSHFFTGAFFLSFGMITYRSKIAPLVFGILLIITGIGYITDSFCFILLKRTEFVSIRPFIRMTFPCAILTMLWFLVMGVRKQLE